MKAVSKKVVLAEVEATAMAKDLAGIEVTYIEGDVKFLGMAGEVVLASVFGVTPPPRVRGEKVVELQAMPEDFWTVAPTEQMAVRRGAWA